jgi:oxidase EvaA
MKCRYDLQVDRIPLREVELWSRDQNRIFHETGNYFEVIAVRVEADNREVPSWTQPLVRPCRDGLLALVAKYVGGVLHYLIQGKVEAGNFDVVEMGPTVQCLTGDYKKAPMDGRPPFLDYVLSARPEQVVFDTLQSEEGGRFYREENRNMVVMADERFPSEHPDHYIWVSHEQLKHLIRFNNIVNIQCRCLLSSIPPEMVNP